ncbi:MAG: carbamate kinase [Desulfurococcales archaeon]|nr:carbamate kinase [Desulfurococcales archaeon]
MASRSLVVVALGGNALLRKGQKGTPEEQWATARVAAESLAKIALNGVNLVITHGNGPQVGMILEAFESLPPERPRPSLDIANAMTQGWLGYLIAHSLTRTLRDKGVERETVVVATRVVVSKKDPSFKNPTKYIGSYYTREEAERLMREKGWVMKPDPRKGWRRVVPSPRPLHIIEHSLIKHLAERGAIVVAVGGGGIPVTEELEPVEAVIDKDLASSLLAREIAADKLVILTDVPGVAINYGRPGERWLSRVSVDELEGLYREGHFPPGSMGPKVEAVIEFVRATGKPAAIGRLEEAYDVYQGLKGTQITP